MMKWLSQLESAETAAKFRNILRVGKDDEKIDSKKLVVCKADKDNAVVVLHRCDYDTKVLDVFDSCQPKLNITI